MSDASVEQKDETQTSLENFYLPNSVEDGVKHILQISKLVEEDGRKVMRHVPSEHWVMVRGYWSDAYQSMRDANASTRARENNLPANLRTPESELQLRQKASVIAGWSFSQECTQENVMALFRKNRKMADALELLAYNEEAFFDK